MPKQQIEVRIFVGGKQASKITRPELDAFGLSYAEKIGRVLNDYFSLNPQEYSRLREATK